MVISSFKAAKVCTSHTTSYSEPAVVTAPTTPAWEGTAAIEEESRKCVAGVCEWFPCSPHCYIPSHAFCH